MSLDDWLRVIEVLKWPAAAMGIAVAGFLIFRNGRTAANEAIKTEQLTQVNRSSRFAGSKTFKEIVSERRYHK